MNPDLTTYWQCVLEMVLYLLCFNILACEMITTFHRGPAKVNDLTGVKDLE